MRFQKPCIRSFLRHVTLVPVVFAVMLLLSGCFTKYMGSADDCASTLDEVLSRVAMKQVFEEMAAELCGQECKDAVQRGTAAFPVSTFLVTDFVDIYSLQPKKYGILMGELMRSGLSRTCSAKIVQAEFAQNFSMSESGVIMLSRDPKKVRHAEFPNAEYVVGTFSYSGNKLLLFARRVDLKTGSVTKMTSREITVGCGGLFNAVSVK